MSSPSSVLVNLAVATSMRRNDERRDLCRGGPVCPPAILGEY